MRAVIFYTGQYEFKKNKYFVDILLGVPERSFGKIYSVHIFTELRLYTRLDADYRPKSRLNIRTV